MGIMKKINEISEEIKNAEFISKEKKFHKFDASMIIKVNELIDMKTGVCYVCVQSANHNITITPRLNADGSTMTVDVNKL